MTSLEIDAIRALQLIAGIGGNLPDDRLTTRTGGNDAVARGEMVVGARNIAKEVLDEHDLNGIVLPPPPQPQFVNKAE